jgi:hypothetical protein
MTISTAGYVDPDRGVYGGVNTSTADLLTGVNQHYDNVQGMRFSRWFFSDIDDTDSWTSNLPGVVAVAWQGADPDDDAVVPFLEEPVAGKITFQAENANSVGWLWVISAR